MAAVMKYGTLLTLGAALVLAASLAIACGDDGDSGGGSSPTATEADDVATATEASTPAEGAMSLTSSAFGNNETIPTVYTCDGDNISPPLAISGVPSGAVALALVMHDPDAPVAGGFTHWVVLNIDPPVADVAEDSVPGGGIVGLTETGRAGYTGPCPPSGTHRYVFTLYALDEALDLDPPTDGKTEIEAAVEGHVLAQAELIGTYAR